jgi:hypothetical protein
MIIRCSKEGEMIQYEFMRVLRVGRSLRHDINIDQNIQSLEKTLKRDFPMSLPRTIIEIETLEGSREHHIRLMETLIKGMVVFHLNGNHHMKKQES